MEQIKTELDLLENAAPEPEETQLTQSQDVSEDTTWKLDMPSTSLTGSQGPILDNDGRVSARNGLIAAGANSALAVEAVYNSTCRCWGASTYAKRGVPT